MTLIQLGLCAASIYATFLIWGLLQERLTKTPYIAPSTLLHPQPDPEYFKSPLFLNAIQAIFSAIVASVYLLLQSPSSNSKKSSLLQRLGLDALTPSGASSSLAASSTSSNGKASKSTTSSSSSSFISPLLVRYVSISALQSTASQLGFLSLRYISYPTLTLAKSCKLVPVLVMNVVLYRRKFARYKYVVVTLVTLGIWMFMSFANKSSSKKGPSTSSWFGLVLCFLNLILDGATNSTQDEVFSRYRVSAGQMMLVMNVISAAMMSLALVFPFHLVGGLLSGNINNPASAATENELIKALGFIQRHPDSIRDILTYALAGAVGQVAIFETLERFGSLTLVSITVTRKLFTMLLSVVVYHHQLSSLQWISVLVVFVGIAIEAYYKRKEGIEKQKLQQKSKLEKMH